MPRNAADLEEALNKKGGLTLSQLANYDDLITDALVDRVYFWSVIRKLKPNYHACRGVQEELVCKILQDDVVIKKDVAAAHKRLLGLPGIAKYYKGLRSDDEKEHFERHLRKYISIYLPDCPFEVDTTNRYTVTTAEACIKARRRIKKGEAIKYLSGIQVEMTKKEEKELSSRTDFSIVVSSRRKRPSLFLGPARFANHDCDSNAKLNTTGPHGIHIMACKDIAMGEEITVTYGEDYFGIDNCECLCATCESHMRNGWDPAGPLLPDDSSDDEEEEESEPVKAKNPVEPQPSSSSALGKRKRGNDVASEPTTQVPRKRGRPRKYPRQDDTSELDLTSAATQQNTNAGNRTVAGSSTFFARFRRSLSRGRGDAPPKDDLLERIFNLLSSIGDRELRQKGRVSISPGVGAIPTPTSAGAAHDIEYEDLLDSADQARNISGRFAKRTRFSPASPTIAPAYAHGLSLGSDERPARGSQPSATPKQKLPVIKQERSTSSLHSVMNVEEAEVDVYSVPPSPVSPETPRRKRGRPPKRRTLDESTDSSDSSSRSSNNDSLSALSQASSATSLGDYTAGNIANSICQMLTADRESIESGGRVANDSSLQTYDAMDVDQDGVPSSSGAERGRKGRPRNTRNKQVETSTAPLPTVEADDPADNGDDTEKRGEPRQPGDYHLTDRLLPTTYHRWVECRNCDEFFTQGEAYLTRIACPRCERHSKLYGYWWPKTDKESKADTEKRVLDHRTVNRFLDPEDERNERKGRKTLADVVRERELSESRQDSEETDGFDKRLRNSPRRSDGRRKLRYTM